MLESIIQFINLKLGLLNYFEKRHCLTTLVKNDDGLIYPAEYITNGDFDAIDFDAYDGVSYMRVNGEVDIARTDQQYTPKPRVEVSFPLKLVYAVRKDKLTQDDAYSWDRVRASIAKQLETDSKDLANTLEADLVQISTSSYMSDTKEIWDEETAETGQFQPKFEVVFGSMEVTVTVTTRVECIPAECDDFESDILKSFDFCSTTVQGRLTPEQITCLNDWLCDSGDPVTIQINGVTYTTAEAGSTFDQQIVNTDDDAVGTAANPSVVGDSTIQINGVDAGFVIAEGSYNQEVVNTDADAVGTAANPSVIGDSTITINGASLGTTGNVVAEGSLNIEVNLDGNPSGSWDGDSWEVTSAPCADATVENSDQSYQTTVASGATLVLPNIQFTDSDGSTSSVPSVQDITATPCADATVNINGVFMDSIPSGGTENIQVRQETGATLVGSKQGQYWRIDDSAISINGSPVADVAAEGSLDIDVLQGGLPVGSWNGSAWIIPSSSCPSVTVTAYSDAGFTTPITDADVSETIYLKAVATDITPTSYRFIFECANNVPQLIYEGANDNTSWSVNGSVGSGRFFCHVTDNDDDWTGRSEDFTVNNDPDVAAFLTATSIVDGTIQTALNGFVYKLKTDGLWTMMNAVYPMVGGTATTHKFNLIDPQDTDAAFRIDFTGGWTHDSNGAKGNGTTARGDTHLVPNTVLSQNDKHISIYLREALNGSPFGVGSPYDQLVQSGVSVFGNLSSGFAATAYAGNNRTYLVNRVGSTTASTYRDDVLLYNDSLPSTGQSTLALSIGARRTGAASWDFYSSNTIAMMTVGDGLSAGEITALNDAINTFQLTLGRDV